MAWRGSGVRVPSAPPTVANRGSAIVLTDTRGAETQKASRAWETRIAGLFRVFTPKSAGRSASSRRHASRWVAVGSRSSSPLSSVSGSGLVAFGVCVIPASRQFRPIRSDRAGDAGSSAAPVRIYCGLAVAASNWRHAATKLRCRPNSSRFKLRDVRTTVIRHPFIWRTQMNGGFLTALGFPVLSWVRDLSGERRAGGL
jgi:hypothetical protein